MMADAHSVGVHKRPLQPIKCAIWFSFYGWVLKYGRLLSFCASQPSEHFIKGINRGVLTPLLKSSLFAMNFAKLFCNGFTIIFLSMSLVPRMGNLLVLKAAFSFLNSLKVIKSLLNLMGNLFPYNIICPQKRQLVHLQRKSLLGM